MEDFFEDLVKVVEDGKGKDDLSVALTKGVKTNHVSSSRQETPTVESCSNISTEETIKFLTGDS